MFFELITIKNIFFPIIDKFKINKVGLATEIGLQALAIITLKITKYTI